MKRFTSDFLLGTKSAGIHRRFPAIPFESLIDHRRGYSRLAGLFLHVRKFLFGVIDGFLFIGYLLFVFRILFVPLRFIAQAVAGVGIHGGGAKLVLALGNVEFAAG